MIVKIGGIAIEPVPPEELGWGWLGKAKDFIEGTADQAVQNEVGVLLKPLGHFLWEGIKYINGEFVGLLPELCVFIGMIFVTIGMFSHFGKWFARATLVYLGGCVWTLMFATTDA